MSSRRSSSLMVLGLIARSGLLPLVETSVDEEKSVAIPISMLPKMQSHFDCTVALDGNCEARVPVVQPYVVWPASSVRLHLAVVDAAGWRRSSAAPSQIVAASDQSSQWNGGVHPFLPCATLDDSVSLTIRRMARSTYAGNSKMNLDLPSSASSLSSQAGSTACRFSRGCRWHGRHLSPISNARPSSRMWYKCARLDPVIRLPLHQGSLTNAPSICE